MKKFICIISTVIMLFSFVSCKSGGGDMPQNDETTNNISEENNGENSPSSGVSAKFALPYSTDDTFNPYKAKTLVNRVMTALLYDGLYRLNENFDPCALIAENAEIASDSVTVTLKEGIHFSDSSPLNAEDVVYSFDQAKNSERYAEQLKGISSASATEKYKVRFVLSEPDEFVLNILTFPIIKYGTVDSKNPYGSGRYFFSTNKLSYNKNHISGEKPEIKSIELFPVSDKSSYGEVLQIGNISLIFKDLSDCDTQRVSAGVYPVTLNNFVYIGMNSKNKFLKDKAVRQAVNLAIDKDNIVSHDYQSYAVRAESPFNPDWSQSKASNSVFDQSQAVELLEENGYTYISDTDKYRSNNKGEQLTLRILVCEENAFRRNAADSIAKNLSQVGIGTEITAVDFKSYKKAVKKGNFDLYIGEVKLCENMSLSPFFSEDGKARFGIDRKSRLAESYKELLDGQISVYAFEALFSENMPFVPICYRRGMVMASNTMSGNIKSISTDIFYNINEWSVN